MAIHTAQEKTKHTYTDLHMHTRAAAELEACKKDLHEARSHAVQLDEQLRSVLDENKKLLEALATEEAEKESAAEKVTMHACICVCMYAHMCGQKLLEALVTVCMYVQFIHARDMML